MATARQRQQSSLGQNLSETTSNMMTSPHPLAVLCPRDLVYTHLIVSSIRWLEQITNDITITKPDTRHAPIHTGGRRKDPVLLKTTAAYLCSPNASCWSGSHSVTFTLKAGHCCLLSHLHRLKTFQFTPVVAHVKRVSRIPDTADRTALGEITVTVKSLVASKPRQDLSLQSQVTCCTKT